MRHTNKKIVLLRRATAFALAFALTALTLLRAGTGLAAASAAFLLPEAGLAAAEEYMRSALDEQSPDTSDPPAADADANTSDEQPLFTAQQPPAPTPEEPVQAPADALAAVPEERRKPIEETRFASSSTADNYFSYGAGYVRNATEYAVDDMRAAAAGAPGFAIEMNSDKPQVLIMHTHTTESFERFDAGFYDTAYPTRSTDPEKNIIAVGKALCDALNANGVCAVQATEYHDYPSYNNSYSRSRETVKAYLARYPSIKIVLDIHRDGMEREDGTRVKPTVVADGRKAAQIMLISGADDGTMDMPDFRENLKLAVRLQDAVETLYPGLTRPVYLAYRYYNQDLTPGSLLIEVGSEASTLEEAKHTAALLGRAFANYFGGM